MLPQREHIPEFESVLRTAQLLQTADHQPSRTFMQEVFEVVRLSRPQQQMARPLIDLIFTVGQLDLIRRTDTLPYWRAILVNAAMLVTEHYTHLPEAKSILATIYRHLGLAAADSQEYVNSERLFIRAQQFIQSDDPEWLLCNIEYRLTSIGQRGFEEELETAIELLDMAKVNEPYAFLLASYLAAEVCVYYGHYWAAFSYGQQALVIADYLKKSVYKLSALTCMLPAVLERNPVTGEVKNQKVAEEIIYFWERNASAWVTPRQEALFFSMAGVFYMSRDEYEIAERYLKKSVQLFGYIEDTVNEIRTQIALAQAMLGLEDYRRAIFWCEEAATVARRTRKHVFIARALQVHGEVLRNVNKYDEAFQMLSFGFDEALHLDESNVKHIRLYEIATELVTVLAHMPYSENLLSIRDDLLRMTDSIPQEEWVGELRSALLNYGAH
jgi:tetratricopeptide (TPR) repeat protein